MTPITIVAVLGILLAATLYTIAVFAERRAGILRPVHLVVFWAGLVADTTATTLMSIIAGGFKPDLHGLLGVGAIAVMLVHSVWATVVLVRKQENAMRQFHKFSLAVWALWMVTLVSGFVLALPGVMAGAQGAGGAGAGGASGAGGGAPGPSMPTSAGAE
jgi:uncharacterized repeat protein (TIGR03987 family)